MFAIKENCLYKWKHLIYIIYILFLASLNITLAFYIYYARTIFGIFEHYCGDPRSTTIARKYVYNASNLSVHLLHATSASSRNKIR